jgi:hypothetical protein
VGVGTEQQMSDLMSGDGPEQRRNVTGEYSNVVRCLDAAEENVGIGAVTVL